MNFLHHFRKGEDYFRYVNICHARSGSNTLLSYLSGHPHVDAHSEIFKMLNGRSIHDVYKEYFGKKKSMIRCAGCKVFYNHPFDRNPDELLQYFMDHPKPHYFIHLMRQDKLRTYISHEISKQLDIWYIKQPDHRPAIENRKLTIDVLKAKYYIDDLVSKDIAIREKLKGQNYISIFYEDLISDPEVTLKNIQNFLNLDLMNLTSTHIQMNPEPLSILVTNYDELLHAGLVISPE